MGTVYYLCVLFCRPRPLASSMGGRRRRRRRRRQQRQKQQRQQHRAAHMMLLFCISRRFTAHTHTHARPSASGDSVARANTRVCNPNKHTAPLMTHLVSRHTKPCTSQSKHEFHHTNNKRSGASREGGQPAGIYDYISITLPQSKNEYDAEEVPRRAFGPCARALLLVIWPLQLGQIYVIMGWLAGCCMYVIVLCVRADAGTLATVLPNYAIDADEISNARTRACALSPTIRAWLTTHWPECARPWKTGATLRLVCHSKPPNARMPQIAEYIYNI